MAAAATSNFSSLLLLLLLSLLSTALTSMHGFIDDPLIQQVVSSSDSRDDLLMNAEHQFSEFKKEYGKSYPTQEEEDYRFGVFISNLRLARRNQILDPSAVHGVTKFSDLTPSEFRREYLGSGRQMQLPKDIIISKAPILSTDDVPPTLNWTKEGAVTSVKDQGKCNSCWAFSTIAVLEGAHYLATNKEELLELSAQQLIDCSNAICDSTDEKKVSKKCNKGCEGGYREVAFKYIRDDAGGVMKADDYSSAEKDNMCFKKSDNDERSVASVKEYHKIEDVDQYASYLYHHGPLAVRTDLEYDQTYKGGPICHHKKHPGNVTHAVTLVGYDESHWIVKNSYGEDWGDRGYFIVCKNVLINDRTWDPEAIYADAVAKKKIDI